MSNNIVGINGQPVSASETPVEPRAFSITLINGEVTTVSGFLAVAPDFIAITSPEGTIQLVVPLASLISAEVVG